MSSLQSAPHPVSPVSPWVWPGLLIAGPAFVVVASIITAFFVVQHPDGLVASDYYKQGKAINAQLSQLDRARQLGWDRLHVSVENGVVVLSHPAALPARIPLEVTLAHPVDPARDVKRVLDVTADDRYRLPVDASIHERRRVYVTDFPARSWRVETLLLPAQPN